MADLSAEWHSADPINGDLASQCENAMPVKPEFLGQPAGYQPKLTSPGIGAVLDQTYAGPNATSGLNKPLLPIRSLVDSAIEAQKVLAGPQGETVGPIGRGIGQGLGSFAEGL